MEEPDIKTLLERLELRHSKKQATTALVGATAVLAVFVLVASHFKSPQPQAVAVAPAPVAPVVSASAYDGIALTGQAAIVYDLTTHEVLYERNSTAQLPLASLTKLLTMYAAATTLTPATPVAIGAIKIDDPGDMGFKTGETFRFEDLARLALVGSSNVAAEAIAQTARAKRDTSTANLMAGAAAAIGLTQTYAVNGSGLDESTVESGGYGSARDIAILSGSLLEKAPDIAHATIESSVTVRSIDGTVHTLPNTNPDVDKLPNVLLSKTGYTDLAGGNLAVVFDAGVGHPIAVVVLGSTHDARFTDVRTLVKRTLDHFAGIEPVANQSALPAAAPEGTPIPL